MSLHPGEMIPAISLPSHRGEVRSGDSRQRRNLVLMFQPRECPSCLALVDALAVCYPQYRELNAQVIVVRPAEPPRELSERLPFPVAWDDTGEAFDACAGRDARGELLTTIYVTDRFGEVSWVHEGETGPELAPEIAARLEFIEKQCPECNTVAEGWDKVAAERDQQRE